MTGQPKVYVIHENEEWLPPLRKAFDNLATPYDEWLLDQHVIDINAAPPEGVFFSRMSASNYTRGHAHANYSTDIVLRWLEAHDRRVINGSAVLGLELSKPAQQLLLDCAGFATPRTVVAIGRDKLIDAARAFGTSPFFVKPSQGGKGLGVQLFETMDALTKAVETGALPDTVDDVRLIQEKIETEDEFITRLEFVGGRFIYAVRVYSGGSFELCPADVCEVDFNDFCPAEANETPAEQSAAPRFEIQSDHDELLVRKLERFLARHEIEVAGIEFIRRPDGTPVIYDINTNTNYNAGAEQAAGIRDGGMVQIARFLTDELGAIARPSRVRATA